MSTKRSAVKPKAKKHKCSNRKCRAETTFKINDLDRSLVGLCRDCYKAYTLIQKHKAHPTGRTWFQEHGFDRLPDPLPDGDCANCRRRPAASADGRLCGHCTRLLVAHLNPGAVTLGTGRSRDHREATGEEPSPWGENAVRAMEGS